MTVLFRVAAGPRTGFGHLRRAATIAGALGVPLRVSLRGGAPAARAARRLGARLEPGSPGAALDRLRPDLLVIDEPVAAAARPWLAAARRRRLPVASVHDLGLAWIDSDLVIDGAFTHPRTDGPGYLLGPRYVACATHAPNPRNPRNPRNLRNQRNPRNLPNPSNPSNLTPPPPTILLALGGGPRRLAALRVARAIRTRMPGANVRIAGGFLPGGRPEPGVTWLPPLPDLAGEFGQATAAVTAGGVSLYEACALGVPTVGVSVTPLSAQRHAVRAGAALGVVLDGGALTGPGASRRIAGLVGRLVDDRNLRQTLASGGRRAVDGQGASRIATHLRRLARKRQ